MFTPSKPLHICVPVLRRYDLLRRLLESLTHSTVQPETIHIVDNGRNAVALAEAMAGLSFKWDVYTPNVRMGLADAWNWFVMATPEERCLVNDDVIFHPGDLRIMMDTPGHFVTGLRGQAFSCFLLRDSCIDAVGLFDVTISPGYAYFEDCDYEERMKQKQIVITHANCQVGHEHSATLKAATPIEIEEHHRRFIVAQENFIEKWGYMPEGFVRQVIRAS